jgi:hypothetical protein
MTVRLLPWIGMVIVALPIAAQGASGPKKLPVCDGKHLRDANVYGSVLPGSPIPAIVAPPAVPPVPPIEKPRAGTPPPPVPSSPKDKISARPEPSDLGSC